MTIISTWKEQSDFHYCMSWWFLVSFFQEKVLKCSNNNWTANKTHLGLYAIFAFKSISAEVQVNCALQLKKRK